MEITTWVTHVNTVILRISELVGRKPDLFAFSEEKQYTTKEVNNMSDELYVPFDADEDFDSGYAAEEDIEVTEAHAKEVNDA